MMQSLRSPDFGGNTESLVVLMQASQEGEAQQAQRAEEKVGPSSIVSSSI